MEDFEQAGISSDCGIFSIKQMLEKAKDGVVEIQWHPDPKPEVLVDLKNDKVLSKLISDLEDYSKQWEKENNFINKFSQAIEKKDNIEIANLKRERDKALGIKLGELYFDIVGITDEKYVTEGPEEEKRAQKESFEKGCYVPPKLDACRVKNQTCCRHGVCDVTMAMYLSQSHWPESLNNYKSDYYIFTNFSSNSSDNQNTGYHTTCLTEQGMIIEGRFDYGSRYSVREGVVNYSVQDFKNGTTGLFKVWDAKTQSFLDSYYVTYGTGFDGSEQSVRVSNERKVGKDTFQDFPKLKKAGGIDLTYRNIKEFESGVEVGISKHNQDLINGNQDVLWQLAKINQSNPGILINYNEKDVTLNQFLKSYTTLGTNKIKEINDKEFLSEILDYSNMILDVAKKFDKNKSHILEAPEFSSLKNAGLEYKIGGQEIKAGRKLF